MPWAITRLRSITDAGSELCADNNLQVPFPLFLFSSFPLGGQDVQDFKEQSEMLTQNICGYLIRKSISLNIRYLVFEVYSIEYKLKITVFCFYIYTTSQLWYCVVLVSAHYTLMKTISWILFSTHSTFEFLWTLNISKLFTIYGLKFIWLYYYLTWVYTTHI